MPEKRLDYSASAENLCNPAEVDGLLRELRINKVSLQEWKDRAQAHVPQNLQDAIAATEAVIATLDADIRAAVEHYGSYQDMEAGMYAVKQRQVSLSYDVAKLEQNYPTEAALVVTKAVNETKLKGLLKGGILEAEQLKAKGITQETVSHAMIIKV